MQNISNEELDEILEEDIYQISKLEEDNLNNINPCKSFCLIINKLSNISTTSKKE